MWQTDRQTERRRTRTMSFHKKCWTFVNRAKNKSLNLINPFPHTTNLQRTTLKIFCQKIENLYNWMDNLWLKVKNIVAKGEIARFQEFFLLSLCFQKAVYCRGVRWGKRYSWSSFSIIPQWSVHLTMCSLYFLHQYSTQNVGKNQARV